MTADRTQSFMAILLTDVSLAIERHEQEASQATKRDLVRVSFAAIEGIAWAFREHVVEWARMVDELSSDEDGALAEVIYAVDGQGKISSQRRYVALVPMIRLTARIALRLEPTAQMDFSSSRWDQLRGAVATRNRITHPKSHADMLLSAEEVEDCVAALFWFLEQTAQVMEAGVANMQDHIGQFRDLLHALKSGDPQALAEYAAVARVISDQ